jgi:hypothetical protein
MRMTLSIPDDIAERFQVVVPARRRSSLITELIERELKKHESRLTCACRAANQDKKFEHEIEEWQGFDDDLSE